MSSLSAGRPALDTSKLRIFPVFEHSGLPQNRCFFQIELRQTARKFLIEVVGADLRGCERTEQQNAKARNMEAYGTANQSPLALEDFSDGKEYPGLGVLGKGNGTSETSRTKLKPGPCSTKLNAKITPTIKSVERVVG